MYNLRYHIASLVAVFLALSLGLILGGVTVQSGALSKQRAALVSGLREDFTKLSQQNQQLQSDLGLQNDLGTALVKSQVADRLQGKNIVIVTNSGQVEGLADAEAAVKDAGGKVSMLTLGMPLLGTEESEVTSALADYFGVSSPVELRRKTAEALAQEWAAGKPGDVTKMLADTGVLASTEIPEGGVDGMIDLALVDGRADDGALDLALALQARSVPAIAVQSRISDTGLARAASNAGVSAMDTLGTMAGRYTIALLLSGAEPGYYGVGAGASAAFPEPPAARTP